MASCFVTARFCGGNTGSGTSSALWELVTDLIAAGELRV